MVGIFGEQSKAFAWCPVRLCTDFQCWDVDSPSSLGSLAIYRSMLWRVRNSRGRPMNAPAFINGMAPKGGHTWLRSSILDRIIGLALSRPDCRQGASTAGRFRGDRQDSRGLVCLPEVNPIVSAQLERRLAVTMIQSHRTPSNDQFVHVFVRNVGSATVNRYSLWLTVINP